MYTVIETSIFEKYAAEVWTEDEREEFKGWIADHPNAGDVIPGTGGLRKVRWTREGMGKRGGARVIYYNRLEHGVILLVIVYAKAKFNNLPTAFLKKLKENLIDG